MKMIRSRNPRRRAVAAVFTLVTLFVLIGFAALTIDVGVMYNARADLQDAADAAALSAAAAIMDNGEGNPIEIAREIAEKFTGDNRVFGKNVELSAGDGIVFGTAELDRDTNQITFTPGDVRPNAVQVEVTLAGNSPNGTLPLYFARIFGKNNAEMSARALAGLAARDINIVVDISGSISYDSQLRNIRETYVNLFDVWTAIPIPRGNNGVGNGIDPPPPGNPNSPNDDPGTGPGRPGNQGGNTDPGASPTGGQRGPTWGWMYDWGTELDEDYDPETDPGLIYLPQNSDWYDDSIVTWFEQVGYTDDEIDRLLSSDDRNTWANRAAVAVGLARWDSGIDDGLWEDLPRGRRRNGDGDNRVENNELTWLVDYPFESGSWYDYLNNYVAHRNASMLRGDNDFRYRVGLKTFIDYVLVKQASNERTPELADTPMQPLEAIKQAAEYLNEFLIDLNGNDHVALTSYSTDARHELDLTSDLEQVSARLNELQAQYYGESRTNIGDGISVAATELVGENARNFAQKVIILLTDGVANVGENSNGTQAGESHAIAMARAAASRNIRIITVSVGSGADQDLMQEIAEIGNGVHFHAEGDIATYSAELADIFQQIGEMRFVQLLQ